MCRRYSSGLYDRVFRGFAREEKDEHAEGTGSVAFGLSLMCEGTDGAAHEW